MSAVSFWSWWADDYLKRSESILWSSKIASGTLELLYCAFPSQKWTKGFASYFRGTVGLTSVYRFISRITPARRAYERMKGSRIEILKFIQEIAFLGASLFYALSSLTRNSAWRYRAAKIGLVSAGIELFNGRAALSRFNRRSEAKLENQQLKIYKIATGILSSLLLIGGAPDWAIAVASVANAVFALYGSYHKNVLTPKPVKRPPTPVAPHTAAVAPAPEATRSLTSPEVETPLSTAPALPSATLPAPIAAPSPLVPAPSPVLPLPSPTTVVSLLRPETRDADTQTPPPWIRLGSEEESPEAFELPTSTAAPTPAASSLPPSTVPLNVSTLS